MSVELKNKINEIGMLLVMTDEADKTGLGLLAEMCEAVSNQIPEDSPFQKIKSSATHVRQCIVEERPDAIALLNAFVTASTEFLEGDVKALFPLQENGEPLLEETPLTRNSETPHATQQTNSSAEIPTVDLGTYMISGERDILIEFAAEAEEHLGNVEEIILGSAGSYSKESIDTIFRGVHSLKGGSAYFNLEEITKTSHLLESLLDEVRSDKRVFDEELKNLVLVYIDLQKKLIVSARNASANGTPIVRSQSAVDFLTNLQHYASGNSEKIHAGRQSTNSLPPPPASETKAAASKVSEELLDKNANGKTFVKIDTARLDLLIDSIGEMAIYSSMLVRLCREQLGQSENVLKTTSQVEKFARDLQDIGMSMRLMPIKTLFQKMSRLVWDTSKKLGKDIAFEMAGEDTELDRNIIDKIADPLMHMVRNSIDHGVESPEERIAKGKPAQGRVKLSAYHSGGNIHIAIEDDGRGLNPEKLMKKAIEKGIVSSGTKLTEQEIFNLIFAPGFSTAAVVTDVSGRGVGMDVVRRNVEGLRGHIHIRSEVDKGSTFIVEIPLTLAMIEGIEIRVGKEHFIIPSLSIVEFIRPDSDSISATLDRGETFYFRGKYLPVFRLADLYGIESEFTDPVDATFIVVENNLEQVAIMVDDIVGEYSTVIKSLGSMFEEGKGISGCAIMPDGSVSLILDIRHLVQLSRLEPLSSPRNLSARALNKGAALRSQGEHSP